MQFEFYVKHGFYEPINKTETNQSLGIKMGEIEQYKYIKRVINHKLIWPLLLFSFTIAIIYHGNTAPKPIRYFLKKYDGYIPVIVARSDYGTESGVIITGRTYVLIPDSLRAPIIAMAEMDNRGSCVKFKAYIPPFANPANGFTYYYTLISFSLVFLFSLVFSYVQIMKWRTGSDNVTNIE